MTGSATVTGGLPIRVQAGPLTATFTPDWPLDAADAGLLGAVLTCHECGAQLGPVRNRAQAVDLARAHLFVSHNAYAAPSHCAWPLCSRLAGYSGYCTRHRVTTSSGRYGGLEENGWTTKPQRKRPTCSIEGCNRPHQAKGYCHLHYQRLLAHGDPETVLTPGYTRRDRRCSAPGCDRPHKARGYCRFHYYRLTRYGDVQADKPLKRGAE